MFNLMKKLGYFLGISALAIFSLVVLFPACEGPAGPAGKDGMDGKDGKDGLNGKDANAFCVQCHNEATFTLTKAQFATSAHGSGEYWVGEGNRQSCARCHSYQGFVETQITGRDTLGVVPAIGQALQCDACHEFHGTLDSVDFPNYALGHTGPVSKLYDNHASTLDFGNSSNLCAYCHQARPQGTDFPIPTSGDKTFKVTSSRWGPHHGPQSHIFNGSDGWEYPGSVPYDKSNHKGVATCSTCHQAETDGTEVGGHTWRIVSEDGSVTNIAACKQCHSDATSLDINGRQTEIIGLLAQLKQKLIDAKLLNASTDLAIAYNNAAGTGSEWTIKQAGAFFNYKMVEEDRSNGVHNYKYVKALLTNSIEALN
jgi:5-methylcytosine-specific restriction endonuclease McrA